MAGKVAKNAMKAAVAGGAAVALWLAAPGGAGAAGRSVSDPPGNNGTVKIDGVAFDDHPDNEPHVGCMFQVDFYGFDEGDLDASVTFELVAPTPGGEVDDEVPIGEDAAGGGTDLDASATYDLSDLVAGVEPHPQQGFHVRLTVHAEGSQGADTKHKEFWVEGCGSTTTTTKPGETTTTKPGHNGGGSTTSETPTNPPGNNGNGHNGNGNGNGSSASGGEELPKTGANTAPLAAAGLTLIALGSAAGLAARRIRQTRAGA